MYGVETSPTDAIDGHPDERKVVVDWNRIRHACLVRYGSRSNRECATHIGVPPRTLDRFRANPAGTSVGVVIQIRMATGLTVDEILRIPVPDAERLAA